MKEFRQPVYLSEKDEPTQRIRCPVHGFIRFSKSEKAVIDHPYFQRLRDIKQLALTDLLYPGANHTRFEHSLGVMHVATMAFDSLCQKKGSTIESIAKEDEAFADTPLAKSRQALRLAALLHDVGHVAFSHAAERVILGKWGKQTHEELTSLIVEKSSLQRGIDGLFWQGCAKTVGEIIRGAKESPPQRKFLCDLISGEMSLSHSPWKVDRRFG
ncbi:MAG: HD domain-containing protein [Deltaproteobacteria bacterium]|nr:HD domain-containing protein [Deltaproteobacteria bacterium]